MDPAIMHALLIYGIATVISFLVALLIKALFFGIRAFSRKAK